MPPAAYSPMMSNGDADSNKHQRAAAEDDAAARGDPIQRRNAPKSIRISLTSHKALSPHL
eukprot:scaffold215326_cov46-Cyclotella_meneghiniana.AAC.1